MYIYKAPNAAGSKITVTSTATGIFDLINTAASTTTVYAGYPSKVNALDLIVESGSDVRVLFDGNTPTATNGLLLSQGVMYSFRGVPLDKLSLIRTGSSNAVCSLQVGYSSDEQSSSGVAYAVTTEAGSVGGSGGAGGGNDTYYAKEDGTNADAVVSYTSATTITVTGLPFTFTALDIASVEQIPTSGDATTFTDKADFSVSAGVITVTGAAFASDDVFVVTFTGPPRTENTPSRSTQTTRLNPNWDRIATETLADITNGTDATYEYFVDMTGYRKGSFQLELNGGSGSVTVTIEGSLQDDGTAAASVTYQDISNATFGAASWTADAILNDDTEKLASYKYVKVKVVAATGGANDADWTIYHKRLY